MLAGLQAIRHLREWGIVPRRPLWLAAWMDEEGQRFGTAMLGSRAFVGEDVSGLGGRRDASGRSLAEVMGTWDRDYGRVGAARAIDGVGAYLEMHVEQGPVLERAGIDTGIVTGIVALVVSRVRYLGQVNHAGATPMELRRDALAGAARAVLALRDQARRTPGMTANVGIIAAEPGATNSVPGACEFTIDVRSPDDAGLAAVEAEVGRTLRAIAEEEGLGLEVTELYRLRAAPMDERLRAVLESAADAEGATRMLMPSGAGHDAQVLARHVPSAMLFVPSRGGVSHSPEEHTSDGTARSALACWPARWPTWSAAIGSGGWRSDEWDTAADERPDGRHGPRRPRLRLRGREGARRHAQPHPHLRAGPAAAGRGRAHGQPAHPLRGGGRGGG